MKKVLVIMALVLALCCVGAAADLIEPGERTIGVDVPAGWYSMTMDESGFSASQVYLPEGCVLDLPETALLAPVAGELPAPDVESGGQEPEEKLHMGWPLYEDDNISFYFRDLRVEEYFGMKLLKTEILLLNKTDDIIRFTCDSIVVNECAVDISVFTDIPGMSRLISTLDSDATIYMKYGISEIETFSMVFEYRGDTIGRFKTKRTDTIEIK